MAEDLSLTIRTSAKAVIVHDGRVLLQKADWAGRHCYFLPGGGQRPGESLGDTARREVHEETGLSVEVGPLLWLREYIGANHANADTEATTHRIEVIFACTPVGDPCRLGGHLQDDVQTGLEWVRLQQVPPVNLLPEAVRPLVAGMATAASGGTYLGDVA